MPIKPGKIDQRKAQDGLQAGDNAPNFSLPGDGGGTLALKDFRGRFLVLYFYPKDDTSGCTAEATDFSAVLPEFEALGATVLGVSPDDAAKHDKFKGKHGLTVALASDADHRVAEAYGAWGEKSLYGRRYQGVLRSTFLIDPKGKIAKVWRQVKVKGHASEVLQALRALKLTSFYMSACGGNTHDKVKTTGYCRVAA
jgi:thioredoxin-dependent peroxiredoxin